METVYRIANATRGVLTALLAGTVLPNLVVREENLNGKVAIVTGANSGIGLESAKKLAKMGANVFLVCRSQERADSARQEIIEETKCKAENVQVHICDFSDLAGVRSFVEKWGSKKIDILLNNAGITSGKFLKSPQGYELSYATNILSHFLLTLELLPHLNENAKIVNVSSIAQFLQSGINPKDLDGSLMLEDNYKAQVGQPLPNHSGLMMYSRTKLLQVCFTIELQKRLTQSATPLHKTITVHACHPGIVGTGIWKHEHGITWKQQIGSLPMLLIDYIGISNEQGCCTPVHLCVSPEVMGTPGLYWDRMTIVGHNPVADNSSVRESVWDNMSAQCGVKSSI